MNKGFFAEDFPFPECYNCSSAVFCAVRGCSQVSKTNGERVHWQRLSIEEEQHCRGKSWLFERYIDPTALVVCCAFIRVQIETLVPVFSVSLALSSACVTEVYG